MKKYLPLFVVLALMGLTACEASQEASDEASRDGAEMLEDQAADEAPDADAAITGTDTNTELLQAMELGLIIQDNKIGDGVEVKAGDIAVMHYTGWLYEETKPQNKGDKFDSSLDRGKPYSFPLGAGRVIKGWDLGVAGMKVGGRRTLIIPSELGYGERGRPGGPIPGGATLVFDVELLELK